MCVALPGRVVAIAEADGVPMATVVMAGNEREINCVFLPDAAVGEYLLTHSGFAVRRIAAGEAMESARLLDEGSVLS